MAEYTHYYDSEEEPLIKLNTYTNEELGWSGEQKWDIQIHYKNLYETEEQNISFTVHNPRSIIDYNTHLIIIIKNTLNLKYFNLFTINSIYLVINSHKSSTFR